MRSHERYSSLAAVLFGVALGFGLQAASYASGSDSSQKVRFDCPDSQYGSTEACYKKGKAIIEAAGCKVDAENPSEVCSFENKSMMSFMKLGMNMNLDSTWHCTASAPSCHEAAPGDSSCPKGETPKRIRAEGTSIAFMANLCERKAEDSAPSDHTQCKAIVDSMLKDEGVKQGVAIKDEAHPQGFSVPSDGFASDYPPEIDSADGALRIHLTQNPDGTVYGMRVTHIGASGANGYNVEFSREGSNCGIVKVRVAGAKVADRIQKPFHITEQSCRSATGVQKDYCSRFDKYFLKHVAPQGTVDLYHQGEHDSSAQNDLN